MAFCPAAGTQKYTQTLTRPGNIRCTQPVFRGANTKPHNTKLVTYRPQWQVTSSQPVVVHIGRNGKYPPLIEGEHEEDDRDSEEYSEQCVVVEQDVNLI